MASYSKQEDTMERDTGTNSVLQEMLQRELLMPLQKLMVEADAEESRLRAPYSFDNEQIANASKKRLRLLGANLRTDFGNELPKGDVISLDRDLFISKMRNRGVELELEMSKLVSKEILAEKTYDELLIQAKEEREASARKLVEQLIELVKKSSLKCKLILKAQMLSRLTVVKCVQRTEGEVSALTKFLSTETTKIASQVYKDALQDRDKQHTRERENHELEFKAANVELVAKHKEVAILSATVKELKEAKMKDIDEAKSNQECCICYHELEGFSLSSGHGESSATKKLCKRACFLPCMHANVCSACSDRRWKEGPRLCPICRHTLTMKPRVIYL